MKNNLSALDILFLSYVDTFSKNKDFQQFWKYKYNINANKYLKDFIDKGYIIDADVYESLKKLKVNDLKGLLKNNDLKITGKKNDLIERIKEYIPLENLKHHVPNNYYSLSDEAKLIVKEHNYIYDVHQKSGSTNISIYEIFELKKQNPNSIINDLYWGIFNKQLLDVNGNLHNIPMLK